MSGPELGRNLAHGDTAIRKEIRSVVDGRDLASAQSLVRSAKGR